MKIYKDINPSYNMTTNGYFILGYAILLLILIGWFLILCSKEFFNKNKKSLIRFSYKKYHYFMFGWNDYQFKTFFFLKKPQNKKISVLRNVIWILILILIIFGFINVSQNLMGSKS